MFRRRAPNESSLSIDQTVPVAALYCGQAVRERLNVVKLRRNDDLAGKVDDTTTFVDPRSRKPFGESVNQSKPCLKNNGAVRVDYYRNAPALASAASHDCHAILKFAR